MDDQQRQVGNAASAFATISGRAAVSGNNNRRNIAQQNIRAAENQIGLEETSNRNNIARSLAQYQGQLAAERAFRGTGATSSGSGAAVGDAATATAADQAAIVESNAAAKRVSAAAANQFIPDDPLMAALQGGIQGIDFGMQISQALLSEAEMQSSQFSRASNNLGPGGIPVFNNTIRTFLDIPGLDLEEMFGTFG